MQQLPDNIRELSHQLTDKRAERRLGYMNENVKLSAYVRYFTWWNLVRLTKLFSNLPEKAFPQNDCVCLDLGSGPLTLITALWLARPELRKKALTWYCLDLSQNSMTFGEDLYYSVAARTIANEKTQGSSETAWKIIRVKGSFGTAIKEKADFITCANMFNELDQAGDMPPEYQTKKYFDQLLVYSNKNTRFLLIEPGVPKAARTISLLRDRFIKAQKEILAPCPHAFECPMNGFKAYTGSSNKWCNFAFSTEDAPARLQKLSDSAKLPKERATLSYVCVLPQNEDSSVSTPKSKNKDTTLIRVVSDSFRLPGGRCGLYACSQFGLTLISMKDNGSERLKAARNNSEGIEKKSQLSLKSGDLIEVKIKTPVDSLSRDEKTGAKIISL
ncbi:MAG: small ribosomal subunit Rsm22 family protein [Treponema sp.]|nr:small ribosomal subunit Rsm22 family protein [Treponema sp.]